MKSERSLNHCDLFRRSYLHCKVRESDGRDVNSALKNNIEGIIIKWTHQVFVNCAQCVLVFFLPSTRHSRWIRCCFRNLCHCICLLQSENCRWMRCYPRSQNKISLSATTQAQWPRSISGRQSKSICTWHQTSPGTLLNNLPAAHSTCQKASKHFKYPQRPAVSDFRRFYLAETLSPWLTRQLRPYNHHHHHYNHHHRIRCRNLESLFEQMKAATTIHMASILNVTDSAYYPCFRSPQPSW